MRQFRKLGRLEPGDRLIGLREMRGDRGLDQLHALRGQRRDRRSPSSGLREINPRCSSLLRHAVIAPEVRSTDFLSAVGLNR